MKFTATQIPYKETGLFTPLIRDYIEGVGTARNYVPHAPTYEGIESAMAIRKQNPFLHRAVLVDVLQKQYQNLAAQTGVSISIAVNSNITALANENTFVVTTAHQPNIFTGPLYFFYKIIHAIQLAADLKLKYPSFNFVPVYYMGSEDADIEEVGGFVLGGAKHQWVTKQTGAIGRMKVDDNLIGLLQNLDGYWSVKPNGSEILALLKKAYQKGKTINDATLELVNGLFGEKGLVVIQPDDAAFKALFIPVMEKELKSQFSHAAVQSTLQKLEAEYHVQSAGRDINLFYLQDQQRLRIEKEGELFKVVDTDLSFSEAAIINELKAHPEKFSPNVILRGVYQETILPGIVFIGGGGELAYWMELANVFEQAAVPYPVLQLRNSFAFIRPKQIAKWNELGLSLKDLFKPILAIEVLYVQQEAKDALHLNLELAQLRELYNDIKVAVMKVDPTLGDHTQNLAHQSEKKLQELEKKMIRAERRKQATQIERIHAIKNSLFPAGSLQERVENMAEWVGDYDIAWIEAIFEYSNTMEQNFTVITISE